MEIIFYKYQGTGNDFIIIDNRENNITLSNKDVKQLCDRKFGIGADGLILFCNKEGYDFEMKYYNADGNISSMCGNGGRCIVQFAFDMGIHKSQYNFLAIDGLHTAEISSNKNIRLKMNDVNSVLYDGSTATLNTGSPHYVKHTREVRKINVVEQGREIRYSDEFKTEGINVNFVETTGPYSIYVRTYERGVEDETLSCGTGVTAAAIVNAHNDIGYNEIKVQTNGGMLSVEYYKHNGHHFTDIFLCGPALLVYKGSINI